MTRDMLGNPLVPGANVDKVDVEAGVKRGIALGFDDATALMVVEYALMRWKRGEEEGADATFLREYPDHLTSWRAILAAAIVAAQ